MADVASAPLPIPPPIPQNMREDVDVASPPPPAPVAVNSTSFEPSSSTPAPAPAATADLAAPILPNPSAPGSTSRTAQTQDPALAVVAPAPAPAPPTSQDTEHLQPTTQEAPEDQSTLENANAAATDDSTGAVADADATAIIGDTDSTGTSSTHTTDGEADRGAESAAPGPAATLSDDLHDARDTNTEILRELAAALLAVPAPLGLAAPEDLENAHEEDGEGGGPVDESIPVPVNNENDSSVSEDEVDSEPWFPFDDEEDIDLGPSFDGVYLCHQPVPEHTLPFVGVEEDEEFHGVLSNGNLVGFFESISGSEFYRNYVRGNTLRKLRTGKEVLKGKPGALKDFFKLPSEILFDLLERFHPIDLLHLSRASKGLRALVLDRRCERVWKSAYYNHEHDLPMPPAEISAPKWTAMMYDDAICDFCGSQGALLDFALDEHYCDRCQGKLLVDQSDMIGVTRDLPDRVTEYLFQLLPSTYRQAGSKYLTYYESESNARYRRKDVMAMIETLQTWYMTIDEGMIPDAGEKFEAWLDPLIKRQQTLSDNAQHYNNWATSYYYTLCTEVTLLQRSLADKVVAKFAKLGHDTRDTEAASSDVFYVFREAEVYRINRKVLHKLEEEIVSKIESSKRDRMKRERRTVVDKFYLDYKRKLKPEQWAYLPPSDSIAYSTFFQDYINQDTLEMGEDLKTEEGMALVPGLIDDWLFDRQKELYETLPGVTPLPREPEEGFLPESQREGLSEAEVEAKLAVLSKEHRATQRVTMLERLRLAKSVFSCVSCKSGRHAGLAVIGWEAACVHMCGSYSMYFHMGWEFCSVGYAAAGALIERVGLNRETAIPEDMDRLNARFFCGNCPVKTRNKVQGRRAMTWRECVTHAVEKEEDHTHAIPAWLLLSPEAAAFTYAHEAPWPSHQKKNWSCNHCPEHLEGPLTFKEASAHVKEAHAIPKPVKDVDVIFLKAQYERRGVSRRRPVFQYGIEPTANLRCDLCRFGSVRKMWTIQALVPHLFHKHGISMPKSTRDYSRIDVLA